ATPRLRSTSWQNWWTVAIVAASKSVSAARTRRCIARTVSSSAARRCPTRASPGGQVRSRRHRSTSTSCSRTLARSSWLAARLKVTTSRSRRSASPSATNRATSAAIVHVLPVPALASSRTVPCGSGSVMSKCSTGSAPLHRLVGEDGGPQPQRQLAQPVRHVRDPAFVVQGCADDVLQGQHVAQDVLPGGVVLLLTDAPAALAGL